MTGNTARPRRRLTAVLVGATALAVWACGIATSAVGAPLSVPVAVVAANGADPELNKASYWVDYFTQQGYTDVRCTKYEPVSTPYILGDPPEGRQWLAIVIKAGAGDDANQVVMNPQPGPYSHSSGKDSAHVIICSIPARVATSTPTTTVTTTPPPAVTATPTTTVLPSTTTPAADPSSTATGDPATTTTASALGPLVETDVVGPSGPSATGLVVTGLAVLAGGAALALLGLRRRGSHH